MRARAAHRSRQEQFEQQQQLWLADEFDALTTEIETMSPSQWAERSRYLPPAVTSMPGFYSFDVAPFVREVLDCMDVASPVREVAWMKAAQICATTGGLENALGYFIDRVKTAPVMWVTADADLAQLRMESYITPMLIHSDLMGLIKSADEKNTRKRGKTDKKLEWVGGGFLIPFGARNANKLRSHSIQVLLLDEVDGWPDVVGKDGDPVALVQARAAAYEATRKVFAVSTPLVKGQSKIEALYSRGDQRKQFVRCLRCEHAQVLRWTHVDNDTGVVTGITWEVEGGQLVPDSVRYLCQHCGHPHSEADKPRLFAPKTDSNPMGAEWIPTAVPVSPEVRSYHLSALYSPAGMQSWRACVQKWLDAWDVEKNRPRDLEKLQVFYNNVLGEPFEIRGERLRFENVSAHRRTQYRYGEVPNRFATQFCGGHVMVVTCAVDVHKDSLKVAIIGWCRDRRPLLLDYHNLEGATEQSDDPNTWGKLREIIECAEYVADDKKRYCIELTLIDSGYLTDHVYRFCEEYVRGVYPVKGTGAAPKSVRVPEFTEFKTPNGQLVYGITVDLYKDRWSAALRRGWDGVSLQPYGHFNAPLDTTDKQLKELTAEVKREKIQKATGKRLGFEWYRASGAANELWDLLIYNNAALDLLAWNMSKVEGLEATDWRMFWDRCEHSRLYFEG